MEIGVPDLQRGASLAPCLRVGVGNVNVLHDATARPRNVRVEPVWIRGMLTQGFAVAREESASVRVTLGTDPPGQYVDAVRPSHSAVSRLAVAYHNGGYGRWRGAICGR